MNTDIKTFATGVVRPKTTALFFDRLWAPWYLLKAHRPYIPSDAERLFFSDSFTSKKYYIAFSANAGEAFWFKKKETRP